MKSSLLPYQYIEEDEGYERNGYTSYSFCIFISCWDENGDDVVLKCKWPRTFKVVIPKGGSLEKLKEWLQTEGLDRKLLGGLNSLEVKERKSRNGFPAKSLSIVTMYFQSSINMFVMRKNLSRRKIEGKSYRIEEHIGVVSDIVKMRAALDIKSCDWFQVEDYKVYKRSDTGFKKYLYAGNPSKQIRALTEEEKKKLKLPTPSMLSFDFEVVSSDLTRHPCDFFPDDRIFCCGVTYKKGNDLRFFALTTDECKPFLMEGKKVDLRKSKPVFTDTECRRIELSGDLLVYSDTKDKCEHGREDLANAKAGRTLVELDGRITVVDGNTSIFNRGDMTYHRSYSKTEEAALLESFESLIVELNPDIILGHNIFGFDFPYMVERMKGKPWSNISKMEEYTVKKKEISWSSSAYNENNFTYPIAPGRIFLDTLNHFKRKYKLNSYSLDSLSSHFLKMNKIDLEYFDMYKLQHFVEGKLDFEDVRSILEHHAPEELAEITGV